MALFAMARARLMRALAEPGRPPTKRLALSGVVLAAAVLAVVAGALLEMRRDAWQRASSSSANLARAIERDLSSEVQSIDLALQAVSGTVARAQAERISPGFLAALIAQHMAAARYLDAVLLLDGAGEVVFDSRQRMPDVPVSLADRDYFTVHRDHAGLGLFLSRPFRSRLAHGEWSIGFSRRLDHPEGGFAGIALGVIRLKRLDAVFQGMQLGPSGSMSLFRDDGIVLARTPPDERQIGRDLSGAPAVRGAQEGKSAQFVAVAGIDGVERFYTQRHLDGVPAFINVALAVEDIDAAWWRKAAAMGGVTLLLAGAMTVLFLRLQRELARRRTLEETERASEANFRLLAENSSDVVSRLDAAGRRLYVSPAAERVLGRPAEELVGRSTLESVVAEDLPAVQAAMERLRAGEQEVRVEYRVLRPDGAVVWLEASARVTRDACTREPDGAVAVARDVTERKALEERLAALARTDGLTGLANRRAFDEVLAAEWRRGRRDGRRRSLLLFGIGRFKLFNDTYGHPAGDACLRMVADAVAATIHRPADLAARYGGEEIAVLLPGTSPAGAKIVAEQVRAAVEQLGMAHAANLPPGVVTASVGVATALPTADEELLAEMLVAAADAALYAAKHGGRNRVATASSVPPPPMLAPVGDDEAARLAALASYRAAGSTRPGCDALDRIVRVAAAVLGMPIAAVSLIGGERQEFIAQVGLDIVSTPRDISFCGHLIASEEEALIVPNAVLDPRFAGNPLVTGPLCIRFYAGAPLVCPRTGQRLGTLCALDRVPRPAFSLVQRAMLNDLAALVMHALAHRRTEMMAAE